MHFSKDQSSLIEGPLLDRVKLNLDSSIDIDKYPFSLKIIKNLTEIRFPNQVTFFVGENGTGKSTILEAVAHHAGFSPEGGSKNIFFKTSTDEVYSAVQKFSQHLILSWRQKPKEGYFFRAESFYNVANYLDQLNSRCGVAYIPYGGKSLHEQSHGESFLSFFKNRISKGGFFLLDEPEAALSPLRQFSLLIIMNQLCKDTSTQFIIATHSPILLAYPNATIYSCDNNRLENISYEETSHYQLTKNFINNPKVYLRKLFSDNL